jgi:hypothetical protein
MLRSPPTLFNYHNANLDGSSDIRDDSNPPPLMTAATGEPLDENSHPQESAHEDSTPEADGRVRSLSPSLSPESSARRTDTRAPWLDEDQIRTADVAAVAQRGRAGMSDAERSEWLRRSGSPTLSATDGAAGALDSQGSAEGEEEPNKTESEQEDAEEDSELPSSCSNRPSHGPSGELASSSSSSAAAAAEQQQPRRRRRGKRGT